MKDSYGRQINYLRLSVTDLCNLRCEYCMPKEGVPKSEHQEQLTHEEFVVVVKEFVKLGVDKVRITGGEPLVKKGIISLLKMIGDIEGINDFALTTNGELLNKYASDIKEAGVKRLNISLDTFDSLKYEQITRGGNLGTVLEGIELAKELGFIIKLNTVYMKGINDLEVDEFIEFSIKHNIDVRFIELMPIGEAVKSFDEKFIPLTTIIDRFPNLKEVEREDQSSPATYYRMPGQTSKIGLIRPISCHFCADCNRVRVTSKGNLKLCLHSQEEVNLREVLRSDEPLDLESLIMNKPEKHLLNEGHYNDKSMNQIGG